MFTRFVQSQTIIFLFFYNQYVYRQRRHWYSPGHNHRLYDKHPVITDIRSRIK